MVIFEDFIVAITRFKSMDGNKALEKKNDLCTRYASQVIVFN